MSGSPAAALGGRGSLPRADAGSGGRAVPADFRRWQAVESDTGDENASALNQRRRNKILERETGLEPATLSLGKSFRKVTDP